MKRVCNLLFVLSIAIIMVSGCGPSIPFTQPSLTPTDTPSPTLTHTPTPTLTPTITYTPSPTPTLFGGFSGKFYTLEGNCTDSGERLRSNIFLYNVNYEIVLWNADGTRIGTLWKAPTPLSLCYIDTEWSPTGDALFIEYWKDGSYLLILDSTGKEIFFTRTGLNFYGGYTGQANWSPDGKWLVFSSYGENDYLDIYRIDSDGNNLVQLTNTYKGEASPLFTPDNKQITYTDETGSLYIMDSDGTNKHLLVSGPVSITDWSADGKKALLWKSSPWDIFVMDFESRETIRYTFDGQSNFEYFRKFSPDGKWIIYESVANERGPSDTNLFILPMDKSQEPLMLAKITSSNFFRFTPDSKYIVFEGWLKDQDTWQIPSNYYAIHPDESGLVVLRKKTFGLVKGKWQPGSSSDYQAEFASSIIVTPTLTPTLVAPWTPQPDLPIYDNFDKGNLLSRFLWEATSSTGLSNFSFIQDTGFLTLQSKSTIKAQNGLDLHLINPVRRNIRQVNALESSIRIDSKSRGRGFAKIQVFAELPNKTLWTECGIGLTPNRETFYFCDVGMNQNGSTQFEYYPVFSNKKIEFDRWYLLRIELDPVSGAIQWYLDDELMETYAPQDANKLLTAKFIPSVGVWISGDGTTLIANFDDVRISK